MTIFVSGVQPVRVELAGEFDLLNSAEMTRCFAAFEPGEIVELDMAAVTFFDSMAIGVLVTAAGRGVRIRPLAMSAVVRHVLEITGVMDMFEEAT